MLWVREHSLICLLTAAAVFTAFWLYFQRKRLNMKIPWVLILSVLHVIVGVLCVKAFAILEAGSFSAAGNMSLFGAIFFLPVFYFLGAKLSHRSSGAVFDVFVIPMAFTLGCARVNCLLSGCCLGRVIPDTPYRYPTREAELVFYIIILCWFVLWTMKRDPGGRLYPVYMIAYGCFRFLCEFFRDNNTNLILHLSHLWAALSIIAGVGILIELNQKRSRSKASSAQNRRKTK